jgi:DNA-binding MarR family transcriptional regulator
MLPRQITTGGAGTVGSSPKDSDMNKKITMPEDVTSAADLAPPPGYMDPSSEAFDLFSSPMYLMAHVDFRFHEDVDKVIGRLGLSRTQYRLLTVLAHRGPLNIGELSACALLKRSTSSHALVAMRRHDWVRTTSNATDGRIIEVELTETGRDLVKRAARSAGLQTRRAMRGLSEQDLEQLTRSLKTIVANLSALPIE